jgi:cysteine synthase
MRGQRLLENQPARQYSMAKGSVIDLVGNTPLVRINSITRDLPPEVEVYAKLEGYNPGGSVKDRAALSMILDAEASGRLTRDKIILDSTSGNTGIAYAWIGAVKGYSVEPSAPMSSIRTLWRALTGPSGSPGNFTSKTPKNTVSSTSTITPRTRSPISMAQGPR